MGALIQFAAARREIFASAPAHTAPQPAITERFQFWDGASGNRYVHTIYDLFDCPDLPRCAYMLVRRAEDGSREVLRIGRTCDDAGSLNLADVRQRAAQLGANEVHVHLLPQSDRARRLAELDLRAGQFASLQAEVR